MTIPGRDVPDPDLRPSDTAPAGPPTPEYKGGEFEPPTPDISDLEGGGTTTGDPLVGGGGTTTAPGEGEQSELHLPGNAELWYNEDADEWYVVYAVPSVTLDDGTTSEVVYTAWLVESDEDLEAIVGPGKTPVPAESGGDELFTDKGVIHLGGVDEFRNFDNLEGDPFDTWAEDMAVMANVRPWILDPEWIGLAVQAAMERPDGQITLEEIQSTTWWKEHNEAERAWMELYHGDPTTAEQRLSDNRANLKYQLAEAGINNATDEIINWLADRVTMGTWSLDKLTSQVAALADPYSVDVIDDSLYEFIAAQGWKPDGTRAEEDTVRGLLNEWLGPVFGNWSDEDIAKQAGALRNDPDAELEFIEHLKNQRVAMYQNYSDRELSYEQIARPWRTFVSGIWGAVPEDTDDTFQKILQVNDPEQAGYLARKTGIERGYDTTVSDFIGTTMRGMRTNVRGAV